MSSLGDRLRAAAQAAALEAASAPADPMDTPDEAGTPSAPATSSAPAAPGAPVQQVLVAATHAAAQPAPATTPATAVPAQPVAAAVEAGPAEGRRKAVPEPSHISLGDRRAAVTGSGSDRFAELKAVVHGALLKQLGPQLYEADMSAEELGGKVRSTLKEVLATQDRPLTTADRNQVTKEITDDILGYGPIEPFLADPEVTEVMVNGPDQVFVERHGRLTQVDAHFDDDAHVRRIIDKIVSRIGRRVDESSPMVDARLPDGSRVNAVIPPLSIDGSTLTIRKFSKDPYTVEDLIRFGSLSRRTADFLDACVRGKLNIVVSGSTGAGKTTTLNVLSSFIPTDERIVTIEDAAELQLHQDHVVRLESRPPNIEGKGEVSIRDLVKNSLRMRPDRIIVGEVRDSSALDMLQAMNTGHDGSICTVHSNGPRDTLARIETMVLMAGMELPVRAIREQVASAVDLIVHQSRLRDGSRKITHVTEVERMEGDVITLQDVFVYDHSAGFDADGRSLGHLRPTGLRPKFLEKMSHANVHVDPVLFARESVR